MRLAAMAAAWIEQSKDPKSKDLSFDERFGMIVDAEHQARDNRKLQRLMKSAQFRLPNACMEDFEASESRGLEKATARQLGTSGWVPEKLNILISGATGVGKSYLSCALGIASCRHGFKALYRRLPRLFEELNLAKADGTYTRVLAKLAKFDVLILDDFGLGHLKDAQRHDLLEVLEDRYGQRSTIIASQLPLAKWHDWLDDPTVADAILDRVIHNAYKFTLKGPSRRKERLKKK